MDLHFVFIVAGMSELSQNDCEYKCAYTKLAMFIFVFDKYTFSNSITLQLKYHFKTFVLPKILHSFSLPCWSLYAH